MAPVQQRMEASGLAAVMPTKWGPKGPHRVTADVLALIGANPDPALAELDGLVAKAGCPLSRSHRSRLRQRARRQQPDRRGAHRRLDQLLDHSWAEADGTQLVPTPEHHQLGWELSAKRRELQALHGDLGQVVLDEPRTGGRMPHGLTIARSGRVGQLRALGVKITSFVNRRATCTDHVPLAEVGPRHVRRLE